MTRLLTLSLHGFRSIQHLTNFAPGNVTILIGANGSGKSNFIAFFRLLSWMMQEQLSLHVGQLGGASAQLFDGPEVTPILRAEMTLETDQGKNDYEFKLAHAANDSFVFTAERYRFSSAQFQTIAQWKETPPGHPESSLPNLARTGDRTASAITGMLKRLVVNQFHNTSPTARIRQKWSVDDNTFLKEDGANLAPFLLRLQSEFPRYYDRIVAALRQLLPFFHEFDLKREGLSVLLRWSERGTDRRFSAGQASDGGLRIMALTTLLLQPPVLLPDLILLDEPELGLHPAAIEFLADALHAISEHTQVVVATQSSPLVDRVEPDQVVTLDRPQRATTFTRHSREELKEWIEDYTLGQLWDKNVLGGRP